MKWKLLPYWMCKPENEFIAGMRRNVALWDRWRWVMILVWAILLAFGVWLIPAVLEGIPKLVEPDEESFVFFWIKTGIFIGFLIGFYINYIFFALVLYMSGFRSERLLLKYYDAQHSNEQSETRRIKREPERRMQL